jgi:hypothetical protein
MTELERSLVALAPEVEWPPTPQLVLRYEPRPRRRRGLVLAVALGLVALGVALAVPPARSAILRFFHLGGVTVERVDTLPKAGGQPLSTGLGDPVTAGRAEHDLGFRMLLPPAQGRLQVYERDAFASVLLTAPAPLLLTEFHSGANGPMLLKKVAGQGTGIEWIGLGDGTPALWIQGDAHVVFFPHAPPRLAGNVLIWQRGEVTLRLEGKNLSKTTALQVARQITP